MTTNERTSKRVAAIAGKVLALNITDDAYGAIGSDGSFGFIDAHRVWHEFKWSDIRALAASALTQASTKKRKTIRSPAKRDSKRKRK